MPRRRGVELTSFYRRYSTVSARPGTQTSPQQQEQRRQNGYTRVAKTKGLKPFNSKSVFSASRSVKVRAVLRAVSDGAAALAPWFWTSRLLQQQHNPSALHNQRRTARHSTQHNHSPNTS